MGRTYLVAIATAFIFIFFLNSDAFAEEPGEPTANISFPDVWGAKTDFPDWAEGATGSTAYIDKDGRIFISFTFHFRQKKGTGVIVVEFFRNKIIFSEQHCNIKDYPDCLPRYLHFLEKTLQAELLPRNYRFEGLKFGHFKDADPPYLMKTDAPFYGCNPADRGYFKIYRQFPTYAEIVLNKSLVYLPPEPVRHVLDNQCYSGIYYLRAYTFDMLFHLLPDGTLIMTPAQKGGLAPPFVVRFKPDLSSPFLDQREDLFLIEHDLLTKFGRLARRLLPPWEAHRANAPVGQRPGITSTHLEIENPIFALYLRQYLRERKRENE
jgi:hypothetical protein